MYTVSQKREPSTKVTDGLLFKFTLYCRRRCARRVQQSIK